MSDNHLQLICIFCKGPAKIVGRCATAKVVCEKCRMEVSPDLYKDQIDNWKLAVCKADNGKGED